MTSEAIRQILDRYKLGLQSSLDMLLSLVEGGHFEAASHIVPKVRTAVEMHEQYLLEQHGVAERDEAADAAAKAADTGGAGASGGPSPKA